MNNININFNTFFGNYANIGSSFGYGNMSSMMSGMLGMGGMYGMSGMYGMGNMMGGMYGMNGMGSMLGMGGMFGMSGSISLPLYGYSQGQAWATTLDTTLGKRDPIYLDTNHDGQLNVEKLKKNIKFDMNGDGITDTVKEWNTQDAQLVYDANGDGQINNGREMMNEVGLNGEQNKYKNGWDKARDVFDANHDGYIDAKELEKASFWTDKDGDGKVDEGEMLSAKEMGITGIDTNTGKFIEKHQVGNVNFNFNMGYGMPGMGGMGYGMPGMGYGMPGMNYGMPGMGNYGNFGGVNGYGAGNYGMGNYGSMGYGMPGMMPGNYGNYGNYGMNFGPLGQEIGKLDEQISKLTSKMTNLEIKLSELDTDNGGFLKKLVNKAKAKKIKKQIESIQKKLQRLNQAKQRVMQQSMTMGNGMNTSYGNGYNYSTMPQFLGFGF
jgi:Ca2+-binding EF-hand superfamily protein